MEVEGRSTDCRREELGGGGSKSVCDHMAGMLVTIAPSLSIVLLIKC